MTLTSKADPASFRATLNGNDITQSFHADKQRLSLDTFVFDRLPGNKPQVLTVEAQPAKRGVFGGKAVSRTLEFHAPSMLVQGNVGLGRASHVEVNRDGSASVLVTLPSPRREITTFTVTPVGLDNEAKPTAGLMAINSAETGQPVVLTFKPGQTAAVFTVQGSQVGFGSLRIESPGYEAAWIDVYVDRSSLSSAVSE